MIEVIHSSGTSVLAGATWCHITEDDILHIDTTMKTSGHTWVVLATIFS
jgi:hypothetical protein